jgi:apolipoprotein D and lipocalin family protein
MARHGFFFAPCQHLQCNPFPYLDADYTTTVIGRTKRDYVKIMSRSPAISDQTYREILQFLESQNYDIEKVQRVPQRVN